MKGALPIANNFSGGTACALQLAAAPTEPRAARTEAAAKFPVQKEDASSSTNPAFASGANNRDAQHSSVSVSLDGKSPAIRLPEAHKTVSPTCDGRPVPTAADRGKLIEQLMASVHHPQPSEFRNRLEHLDPYELRQFHFSQFQTC